MKLTIHKFIAFSISVFVLTSCITLTEYDLERAKQITPENHKLPKAMLNEDFVLVGVTFGYKHYDKILKEALELYEGSSKIINRKDNLLEGVPEDSVNNYRFVFYYELSFTSSGHHAEFYIGDIKRKVDHVNSPNKPFPIFIGKEELDLRKLMGHKIDLQNTGLKKELNIYLKAIQNLREKEHL